MGQTASHHHHHHHYHHHHCPMDAPQDSPASPRQVRQRVQQQQQEREQGGAAGGGVGPGGCCGAASCSCGGGLSSTAALYGTTPAPRTPDPAPARPVVVTPPRSLPPHHHHHHHQWPESPSTPGGVNPSASPSGCSCGPGGGAGRGCSHWCSACRVRVQLQVECVGGVEGRPAASRGGRLRTLAFPKRGRHKAKAPPRDAPPQPKKKKAPWTLRLNCRLRPSKAEAEEPPGAPQGATASVGCGGCMCPGLRRPDPDPLHPLHHLHLHHTRSAPEEGVGGGERRPPAGRWHCGRRSSTCRGSTLRHTPSTTGRSGRGRSGRGRWRRAWSLPRASPLTPARRAWEAWPSHTCSCSTSTTCSCSRPARRPASLPVPYNPMLDLHLLLERSLRLGLAGPGALLQQVGRLAGGAGSGGAEGALLQRTVHTQVDYIHCLVPDLLAITNCVFYWGKMDRYEAERLLDTRPEGTFLLRDSAQEEYLFSVSFRRYGRSLHARIEQWNHRFSFDSHDPGVFASDTVCGLIEHYKDPSCCMFFEPMLTNPLARTFPFPLQHLCRAAICSATTYDGINRLRLPKPLHTYLKEYHYKQRVRVRRLDH
ncbi:uncharacterized protein LOC135095583 [Scylla paramamosain]|uniref:uncharacterized protein LOC135095583 n=1 Tax=Scylla paramamosain TaxID=85552 RepID=UPI003083B8B4